MEENVEELKNQKKFKPLKMLILGVLILFLALIVLQGLKFLQKRVESKQFIDANKPRYGWVITEDLGFGEVPGGSVAQLFEVSHDWGWEVLAYCLEPEKDAPAVGTHCDLINEDTFWCGDDVQQIRIYKVIEIPPERPTRTLVPVITNTSTLRPRPSNTSRPPNTLTPTNTPTNTATNTLTNTPTSTQTNTATNTPTNTATNTPTNTATSTSTNTPTATSTSTPAVRRTSVNTPTQTVTPTQRPKMGGDGNFNIANAIQLVLGLMFIGLSIVFGVVFGKRFQKG